jgi:hypothetical protein
MTGQAALFDAPTMDGQAPLFGSTYEWAIDPGGPELVPADRGELGPTDDGHCFSCVMGKHCGNCHCCRRHHDDGPELVEWNGAQVTRELVRAAAGEVERDRIRKQTERYYDAANKARDHRRECDVCARRGRCSVSRQLDKNQRAAAGALRMMKAGEL